MSVSHAGPAIDAADSEFDYESIPSGHYDSVFRRRAGVQSKWHHLKFDRFRACLQGPLKHLDIACGPGTFIGTLEPGIESTGVDIAQSQIDYAESAYGAPGKRFDVVAPGRLPYADGEFDVATCIELLEHLTPDDGLTLLREARRVIAPGGRLLLSTPDYGGGWPVLEWLVNRLGGVSYEDQHITHFTRARLAVLLERAGFADVAVERYQFLAPFAAALGWRMADVVRRCEPRWLTDRFGFLLFATAWRR